MREMPNAPDAPCCKLSRECVCGPSERVLRAVIDTGDIRLTPEQREWCLSEIASVEGYSRADYEGTHDVDIAHGVLDAWTDFCRDKGLLP
jgi:hypothetical protein